MLEIKRICRHIKRILKNRKKVSFSELDMVLKDFGYEQKNRGSSHYVYRKKGVNPITVPYKRPYVKECYVRNVIKQLNLEEFYEEHCRKS